MSHVSNLSLDRLGAKFAIVWSLACVSLPGACWATEQGETGIQAYAKLYPEWKWQQFGQQTRAGTDVGTMGTLRNDNTRLAKDASGKDDVSDQEWASSYAGVRGRMQFDRWRLGFDLQAAIDMQGDAQIMTNLLDNLETRDAFVYVELAGVGRLALGKMDSAYKDFVEKGSLLGLTNGNFVSYSLVNARAGWKGKGSSTFFNRRSHSLGWSSDGDLPVTSAITHSWDERPDGPGGQGTQLTAAALRWRAPPWTVTLATEVHRNWLPMSRGASTSPTSIYNDPASTQSRDQAWRLGFSWVQGHWRVAGDASRMRYAETDPSAAPGKFRGYRNHAVHVNASYKPSARLELAANHIRADAGVCSLSGNFVCSTQGLGGSLTSLGALFSLNRHWSLFALASRMRNDPAAYYGSAPQGANIDSLAIGVQFLSR